MAGPQHPRPASRPPPGRLGGPAGPGDRRPGGPPPRLLALPDGDRGVRQARWPGWWTRSARSAAPEPERTESRPRARLRRTGARRAPTGPRSRDARPTRRRRRARADAGWRHGGTHRAEGGRYGIHEARRSPHSPRSSTGGGLHSGSTSICPSTTGSARSTASARG